MSSVQQLTAQNVVQLENTIQSSEQTWGHISANTLDPFQFYTDETVHQPNLGTSPFVLSGGEMDLAQSFDFDALGTLFEPVESADIPLLFGDQLSSIGFYPFPDEDDEPTLPQGFGLGIVWPDPLPDDDGSTPGQGVGVESNGPDPLPDEDDGPTPGQGVGSSAIGFYPFPDGANVPHSGSAIGTGEVESYADVFLFG